MIVSWLTTMMLGARPDRTFEGAYIRTALSQFSFALVILKIFTSGQMGATLQPRTHS